MSMLPDDVWNIVQVIGVAGGLIAAYYSWRVFTFQQVIPAAGVLDEVEGHQRVRILITNNTKVTAVYDRVEVNEPMVLDEAGLPFTYPGVSGSLASRPHGRSARLPITVWHGEPHSFLLYVQTSKKHVAVRGREGVIKVTLK